MKTDDPHTLRAPRPYNEGSGRMPPAKKEKERNTRISSTVLGTRVNLRASEGSPSDNSSGLRNYLWKGLGSIPYSLSPEKSGSGFWYTKLITLSLRTGNCRRNASAVRRPV